MSVGGAGRNFQDSVAVEVWEDLLACGRRRLFQPGHILMHQGSTATSVSVLTEGTVRVRQTDEHGHSLTIKLRGPGEVLGDYGVLLERPRSATVDAATRCTCYVVPAAVFRRFARQHELAGTVLRLAVERLEQREELDNTLAHLEPEQRLARILAAMAEEVGRPVPEGVRIDLGMPREDLGSMASMSRTLVYDALGHLQNDGLVLTGRQHLVVVDLAGLKALSRRARRPDRR
ncbi:Crp/Fnr family transcriptional regulator [Kribbella sp. NPDC051587]|uniref:Crp/Fnr family transcriptional regulator n=1 Tax=Kribbella sp. NPDC051587 TaxID=3364119 RepID=UPI00379B68D5